MHGLELPDRADEWRLICDLLESSSTHFSDATLFKEPSGKTLKHSEVAQHVDDLGRGMLIDGFASGDKIGLIGERNSSDWCISYLAILRIGAVVVPLDPSLKADELATMLGDCGASGAIATSKFIETLKKIRSDTPFVERIVGLDRTASFGVPTIEELIGRGRGQTIKFPSIDPDSLAVLIYTSGTTGKPKGVMLSHANIVADIKSIHRRLSFGPEDVFLSILPLHHTFECTCGFLTPMSTGCTIAFARSFKSTELLEDMRASNATVMCGVPLLFEKMYLGIKRSIGKSSTLSRSLFKILFYISSYGLKRNLFWGKSLFRSLRTRGGLDCMRLLVSGAAALPYEVAHFFNAIGINLVQGYGLSETSPVLSVNSIEHNRFDSIGPALDGVEVRIDNPDPNGVGEIVVKGPMIMQGYYGNATATAAVLRQGWFFTGDVGRQDSDGYLYITGRSKNVIVSAAGKNIHPEEIEEHLNLSPYILESLVLGRKLPNSNVEDVTAVIVPDRDFIMQSDDLQNDNRSVEEIIKGEVWDICSRLADYKRVKRFFIRDEELPKTSSKKIKRCLDIDDAGNLFEKKKV